MAYTLTQQQREDFDRDGFLILPAVLEDAALTNIRAAMAARVETLLAYYQRLGRGDGGGAGGFNDRLTQLLQIAPEAYQHIDISLPLLRDLAAQAEDWQTVFGAEWQQQAGIYADDSIFQLITHKNIVSIATQLLGDEVVASPVQHVRIKPPQRRLSGSAAADANTARTLWHQDEAVVTEEARGVDILTVWVAITAATPENGCMEAIAGSHKVADTDAVADFGLTAHCPGKGELVGEIYIPETAISRDRCVPLIAQAGDVVLLHRRTIHGARANTSDGVRWSCDMRYQPTGTPSGRDCFPSTVVASRRAPDTVVVDAAAYCDSWLTARDEILSGDRPAIFNSRWNKYAPICA